MVCKRSLKPRADLAPCNKRPEDFASSPIRCFFYHKRFVLQGSPLISIQGNPIVAMLTAVFRLGKDLCVSCQSLRTQPFPASLMELSCADVRSVSNLNAPISDCCKGPLPIAFKGIDHADGRQYSCTVYLSPSCPRQLSLLAPNPKSLAFVAFITT